MKVNQFNQNFMLKYEFLAQIFFIVKLIIGVFEITSIKIERSKDIKVTAIYNNKVGKL